MKVTDRKLSLEPDKVAAKLSQLLHEEDYKDVTISIQGVSVLAHKCILATGSSFFKLLFRQAQKKRDLLHRSAFELVGLTVEDARFLELVIEFLYTGTIYLNSMNFAGVVKLADYLVSEELLDLCHKYLLETLSKENCLKVYLDLKKAVLGGESMKTLDRLNENTRRLFDLTWNMVQENFYEHLIDHHEFFEVLPEEVEKLIREELRVDKILKLVVRWMNTWPLGFTFADNLVNLIHNQLDVLRQQELSQDTKTCIVQSVKTIREQVLSRTVPKSNRASLITKLHDIREVIEGGDTDISDEVQENKEVVAAGDVDVNAQKKDEATSQNNGELVAGNIDDVVVQNKGEEKTLNEEWMKTDAESVGLARKDVETAVKTTNSEAFTVIPDTSGVDTITESVADIANRTVAHENRKETSLDSNLQTDSFEDQLSNVFNASGSSTSKNVVVEMVPTEVRIPEGQITGDTDERSFRLDESVRNDQNEVVLQNSSDLPSETRSFIIQQQMMRKLVAEAEALLEQQQQQQQQQQEYQSQFHPGHQQFRDQAWDKAGSVALTTSGAGQDMSLESLGTKAAEGLVELQAQFRARALQGTRTDRNSVNLVNQGTVATNDSMNDNRDQQTDITKLEAVHKDVREATEENVSEDMHTEMPIDTSVSRNLSGSGAFGIPVEESMFLDENSDTDIMDVGEVESRAKKSHTDRSSVGDGALTCKSLQERVVDCLRHRDKIKAEVYDNNILLGETPKSSPQKRKRGRPRRYVQSEISGEETDLKTLRESNRNSRRKVHNVVKEETVAKLDGTMVKIEVGPDGEIADEYIGQDENSRTEGVLVDENSQLYSRRITINEIDIEGDSDDDYSEKNQDETFTAIKDESAMSLKGQSGSKKRKRSPRKPGHHECSSCGKVFTQKYRLTQHMNIHLGIKPHKCVVCQQTFTRTDHVVRHMRTQHSDMGHYECNECGVTFETVNEIVAHTMTHQQSEDDFEETFIANFTEEEKEYIAVTIVEPENKHKYSCNKCNLEFKKPYLAREHVSYHTGLKPFKCEQCDISYGERDSLTAHIRTAHDEKLEYRCPKCRRIFMKKENYDSHIEQCEPRYKCERCDAKFYRKGHLDNHMPSHESAQHNCPQCDNTYRYRKHLVRHLKKDHQPEKNEPVECICDTCGVVVKNKEALYRHKKTHRLPDKECDVCGKAFKDNTTLKDHKLMHTDTRDYQCEICSMLFRRKGNLVRHQKRHRGERKYRCEVCGMCFVANCDLTRHKNTHLGVKKYPCRYCGRKFGLKSKVVVHERTHTGERPYVCRGENCGKTFKQTGDRVRHEKKVHNLTINKYMTLYELAQGKTEDIFKLDSDDLESKASAAVSQVPVPNQSVIIAGEPNVTTIRENMPTSLSNFSTAAAAGLLASGFGQKPEVDQTYIEEADMSKIFQRTVEQMTQEAITNSGIQF